MSGGRIPEGTCICSVCGEEKDNSHFFFYNNRIDRKGNRIRINTNCHKCASHLGKQNRACRVKYEVPAPGSKCHCCEKPTKKFEFDHDHETGEYRGWLCKNCNIGQGKFGDTIFGSLKLVRYQSRSISFPVKVKAFIQLLDVLEEFLVSVPDETRTNMILEIVGKCDRIESRIGSRKKV